MGAPPAIITEHHRTFKVGGGALEYQSAASSTTFLWYSMVDCLNPDPRQSSAPWPAMAPDAKIVARRCFPTRSKPLLWFYPVLQSEKKYKARWTIGKCISPANHCSNVPVSKYPSILHPTFPAFRYSRCIVLWDRS